MLKNRATFAIVTRGALAGWAAGAAFLLFQVAVTAGLGQPPTDPIRLAATIILGQQPFPPDTVLMVGLIVHSLIAIAYGVVFFVALAAQNRLITDPGEIILRHAMLYAALIWLLTAFVLVPYIFKQFVGVRPVLFGVAHIVVFGPALAAMTLLLRDRIVSIEFDLFYAEKHRIAYLQRDSPHHKEEEAINDPAAFSEDEQPPA